MKRHTILEEIPWGFQFFAVGMDTGLWLLTPVYWIANFLRGIHIAYLGWQLRKTRPVWVGADWGFKADNTVMFAGEKGAGKEFILTQGSERLQPTNVSERLHPEMSPISDLRFTGALCAGSIMVMHSPGRECQKAYAHPSFECGKKP